MADYDIRKISILACIALVVLRLSIGWQLLYEGLWKLDSQNTASAWTAEPYLKNSQGPLRDYFRSLSGDPDDLRDLDYETVAARWTGWAERFKQHYQLDDRQKRIIDEMVHGSKDFRVELNALPEGVELTGSVGKVVTFLPDEKRLIVDGKLHLTPREKQALLAQVNFNEETDDVDAIQDEVKKDFVKKVLYLYKRQSSLSYLEKALASLKGDPEWAGSVDDKQKGTLDGNTLGKIQLYRDRLDRYEQKLANVKTHFDQDHLDYDWKEIQTLRAELVGPIRKLESDMKWDAEKMLSTSQLALGPMQPQYTAQRDIDLKTMWGLTIIGGLLLAGFMTRVAALGGAFLLLQFYLAYPPIPGYPQPPGPEHAIVINKTFIEVLVLLVYVFLPTGSWFGIDAIFSGFFKKKPADDR
ncbi:hypothetical protein [Rubinisphaera italica]|uniref:DoxX n=1 Tax=Rubinisphaera italica TaxID=2527969 RepID=A0A5C5X9Y2_9PLAN|nr:hypothetical protein [Rubinisphaera italica]TWT59967.1 hypothetical protein Pan54_06780 [Rubinisphaera italica]